MALFQYKKNKSQRVCNRVLTGSCRVNPPGQPGHTRFFLPLFFLQPGPIPAPGRPAGPGRVSKLCSVQIITTCYERIRIFTQEKLRLNVKSDDNKMLHNNINYYVLVKSVSLYLSIFFLYSNSCFSIFLVFNIRPN